MNVVWRAALSESDVEDARALVAAAADVDGTAPVGEHVLLTFTSPAAAHVLVRAGDGALAGFAQLDGETAELAVHPARRRNGVGTRLVEELLTKERPLSVWAHGNGPGAVALATKFGFAATRELWQMRRGLLEPPPAEPELPDGVRLRPFVVGQDEAEFLRVNNAAFDWHPEQGGWDVEQVRVREEEPWFDADGFLLAVDADDRLLGYHWTKVHPNGAEPVGEVYVLGVDPSARGMRLGSALTAAGLRYLRERGLRTVMLYVEGDNEPAIAVYRGLGFTRWDVDVSYSR